MNCKCNSRLELERIWYQGNFLRTKKPRDRHKVYVRDRERERREFCSPHSHSHTFSSSIALFLLFFIPLCKEQIPRKEITQIMCRKDCAIGDVKRLDTNKLTPTHTHTLRSHQCLQLEKLKQINGGRKKGRNAERREWWWNIPST